MYAMTLKTRLPDRSLCAGYMNRELLHTPEIQNPTDGDKAVWESFGPGAINCSIVSKWMFTYFSSLALIWAIDHWFHIHLGLENKANLFKLEPVYFQLFVLSQQCDIPVD